MGPKIFVFVFGDQWLIAGILSRSLILWLAFAFCNLPAILFAKIIRIQRFLLIYDILLLILRSLSLIIGGIYLDVFKTVLIFALIGAAMNAYLITKVGFEVMKREGQYSFSQIRKYFN